MDYEKAYKEALERAKSFQEKYGGDYAGYIFPDLRESEDERIRKEIIALVRAHVTPNDTCLVRGGSITREKAEAWLEKQKEPHYTKRNALFDKCVENCDPKTVEEVNKRVDDIMNMSELSAFEQALTNFIGYWEDDEERWPSKFVKKHGKHILDMARAELQKEKKHSDGCFTCGEYKKGYEEGRRNGFTAGYNKAMKEVDEQKEQKPNIELIQRSWYMEGYHDRAFGQEPKWIIKTGEGGPKHELNPRYGQPLTEQRPTEEQLHNLNEVIKSLRMDGCERMADSLHSLYNILNTQEQKPISQEDFDTAKHEALWGEQKPAEWSEEDERMLARIIERGQSQIQMFETGLTPDQVSWLKSLRSRPKSSDNWKPSEEQMKALQNAIALTACDKELVRLYNQLKKLM